MRYLSTIWIVIALLAAYPAVGQEICDNAIDDDGDGLIDLLDDECICLFQVFDEVIGDFEDYDCCPDGPSQFDCLNDGWVTISGTPDFFNTCDYIGDANWTMLQQPIPSGEGAAAVIGGEHFGICMDNNMIEGEIYDLSFWVEANTPIEGECEDGKISLFGATDCAHLSSPVCGGPWTEIGSWPVSTGDEWTEITFSFGISNGYSAVAFGFQCNQVECPVFPYIFLDNINISGIFEGDPDEPELILDGNCVDGFTLQSIDDGGLGYQWYRNGVAIVGATTNPWTVDPAEDGFYQVLVEYDIGCVISDSSELSIDLNTLSIQATEMDVTCFEAMDGSIAITTLSPNMPINYQWSSGESTATITDLGPGTYTVTVTDANGCFQVQSFTITEPPLLTAGAVVTQPLGANLGQAQVSAFGGTAPYVFEWPDGSNSVIRTDLEPGQYIVSVTDANGCEEEIIIDIFEPLIFDFDTTPQTCLLSCDGAATLLIEGGLSPYIVLWSDGFQGEERIGLCGGVYFFTITDDFGSTLSGSINIGTNTEIELTADYQEAICIGATTDIEVSPSGGQSPYTFQWLFGENTPALLGVVPGTYLVTVTDDAGCSVTAEYDINELPEIDITGVETNTPCGLSEGGVASTITGGVAPYSYLWSTGSMLADLVAVSSGIYQLTVTDSAGCTAVADFVIDNISDLNATAAIVDVSCPGDSTGSISIDITGGTQPYDVTWSNGQVGPILTNVPQGDYSVIIVDAGSCQISYDYTLIELSRQTAEAEVVNVDCFGAATGSITVEVLDGIAPYTYVWEGTAGANTYTDLAAGTYELTITDSLNCSYTYSYSITEEDSFFVQATINDNLCYQASDGSISISVAPDSTAYQYVWSNGQMGPELADVPAGPYSLTVTNALGCAQSYGYTIVDGIEMTQTATVENLSCTGNGSIALSVSGGNGGYTYLWSTTETESTVIDLSEGLYTVTVLDSEGCMLIDSYEVMPYEPLSLTASITDALCFEAPTGSISLQITGGDTPYSFLWSEGSETIDISGLLANMYSVTVTDSNDCTAVDEYSISQPDQLILNVPDTEVPCSGDEGTLEVFATGGVAPYTVLWSTGSVDVSITESTGDYGVTVTDAAGCASSSVGSVFAPDALMLELLTSTEPTTANGDGIATIDIQGGVEPYTISWSSGATMTTASNLSFGLNTVTVTDAGGCIATLDIIFDVSPLVFMAFVGNNPCHEDCKGQIEIKPSGGILPYTISWSTGAEGSPLADLCEGMYTATISDASGQMVVTEPIFITNPTDITIDGQTFDISCVEMSDGSIEVTASGGTMPFVFTWNNNESGSLLSELPVGSYVVTATDDAGCEESTAFTLDDIPLLFLEAEGSAISCNRLEGLIAVAGDNPYEYPILVNGEAVELTAEGVLSGLAAGTYAVSYEVNPNCILSVAEIEIVDLTNYSLALQTASTIVNEGESVTIRLAIESGFNLQGYTIEWTAGQPFICSETNTEGQCVAIELSPEDADLITAIFIDAEGCETVLTLPITVLRNYDVYVPNVFHPQSTSGNEVFNIVLPKWIDQIDKFYVFDRWGNKVYSAEEVSKQTITWWNGTFQGRPAASGVYVYYIEVTVPEEGPKSYVGDVTLLR